MRHGRSTIRFIVRLGSVVYCTTRRVAIINYLLCFQGSYSRTRMGKKQGAICSMRYRHVYAGDIENVRRKETFLRPNPPKQHCSNDAKVCQGVQADSLHTRCFLTIAHILEQVPNISDSALQQCFDMLVLVISLLQFVAAATGGVDVHTATIGFVNRSLWGH